MGEGAWIKCKLLELIASKVKREIELECDSSVSEIVMGERVLEWIAKCYS